MFRLEGKDKVTKNIKKELIEIDKKIDTLNSFEVYRYLYNYLPDKSIIKNSYSNIKKDIRLSSLKAISSVSGSEKMLYELQYNNYKGFQFCIPEECGNIFIRLFDEKNNELVLIVKNFTQNEIDFVLSSLEWNK